MSDLVVIGGGAAGLFAAGFAAKGGASVTVLERGTRPARKLLITGKGRCNVTNNCSPEDFLRNVRTNPRFLYGAASAFSRRTRWRRVVGAAQDRWRPGVPGGTTANDVVDALVRFAKRPARGW
ncbi:MAG: FAD-dependent oxidoreductase [Anaerotruncus massiliensis (ex Togo et al. 2019)]